MYKYCPKCGAILVTRQIKGFNRRVCPNCGFILWSQESISVGGIVTKENKILLVQRASNPGRGLWTIPGGFVEQKELISDGVTREIKEETGLTVTNSGIILICEQPQIPHNIYPVFHLEYQDGVIHKQSDELLDAKFFSENEMNTLKIADLTRQVIKQFNRYSQNTIKLLNISPENSNGYWLYGYK